MGLGPSNHGNVALSAVTIIAADSKIITMLLVYSRSDTLNSSPRCNDDCLINVPIIES